MTPKEEIEQQLKIAEDAIEKAKQLSKEHNETFELEIDDIIHVIYRPKYNELEHIKMYGSGWESSDC